MSFLLATPQLDYLTNKEKEELRSDEDGENYNFKVMKFTKMKIKKRKKEYTIVVI